MKTTSAFALIVLAGGAAFFLGGWTSPARSSERFEKSNTRVTSSSVGRTIAEKVDASARTKTARDVLTVEKAASLTPEERIALLKKAAALGDPNRQADILCGLISAMGESELTAATAALMRAQQYGNDWSQAVWNTLWTQWGTVAPQACLALSAEGEGLNTSEDYRCMMVGWMSVDPEAALAWAKQPDHDSRAAAAAAVAITRGTMGDLKKMETAIAALSPDGETAKACLHDYFDIALAADGGSGLSGLYEKISPALRTASWPVVMQRLAYTDPQQAADWLTKHAGEPGSDYSVASRLVNAMAQKDPEKTAKWAVGLPVFNIYSIHPGFTAISRWQKVDPVAATAWLKTQPPGLLEKLAPQNIDAILSNPNPR